MVKFAANFCYCAVDQEKAVLVREKPREPPQNWSGDELVREMLRIGPGASGSCAKTPDWSGDAQNWHAPHWSAPGIFPGLEMLTWFGGDAELVWAVPLVLAERWLLEFSGKCPELVREPPRIGPRNSKTWRPPRERSAGSAAQQSLPWFRWRSTRPLTYRRRGVVGGFRV